MRKFKNMYQTQRWLKPNWDTFTVSRDVQVLIQVQKRAFCDYESFIWSFVLNWKVVLFLMEKAAIKCFNDTTNEGENYKLWRSFTFTPRRFKTTACNVFKGWLSRDEGFAVVTAGNQVSPMSDKGGIVFVCFSFFPGSFKRKKAGLFNW